ncbi:MAG TPA: A/G-specific adenine glycosylase [Gammaproteobacteria bacterium]|nr:A/G-specific adenine glycosylase [Gammaproteobacteria bacterium]
MILETKSIVFSNKLIHWQSTYGRNNLPWQENKTAYRVWVSEIMLQQTQVSTVINYYDKFIKVFPTVEILAKADLQDVLAQWSGLGFYRRAQNLHKCAQIIHHQHQNIFPRTALELKQLPGIGRSTAAAISSICFNAPEAILDGNVKRVLTRYFYLTPEDQKEKDMITLAQALVPKQKSGQYTQAIMDMGATICTKHQPKCPSCPVNSDCMSHKNGIISHVLTTRIKQRKANYHYLIIENDDHWLFKLRGEEGIWANLWTPPEFKTLHDLNSVIKPSKRIKLATTKHTLSHIIMNITFWKCDINDLKLMPKGSIRWHPYLLPTEFATPKPFTTLLKEIHND